MIIVIADTSGPLAALASAHAEHQAFRVLPDDLPLWHGLPMAKSRPAEGNPVAAG
ncbi:hypothetical protein [Streptomyces mirabilis]